MASAHATAGGQPAHFARLSIASLWQRTRGAGITIAVIDSGVASVPTAFAPQRVRQLDEHGAEVTCRDVSGHGTACVSLIASTLARAPGIAPEADVRCYGIALPNGRIDAGKAALSIQHAIGYADIISCSFVMANAPAPLLDAVRASARAGKVLVAAAGNDQAIASSFPEQTTDALVVAGLAADGSPLVAGRRGMWIDVAAPGERLPVVSRTGLVNANFGQSSGAAALVAGVCALALAAMPPARRRRAALALPGLARATARDLGPAGSDPASGAGSIDPAQLIAALDGIP